MELKNAVAVCLISLFSATLVLLIARALDLQTASQLEPQLAQIAEELQAIRKGGGVTAASGGVAEQESIDDGVVVYYFHGNMRCPTCRSIESQAHEIVHSDFAEQLESGKVVWKTLNCDKPAGAELAKRFEVYTSVVVLAKTKDGQIEDWKRLDRAPVLVSDEEAFANYVREEINRMLQAEDKPSTATTNADAATGPAPELDSGNTHVPSAPTDLPLP